MILKIYSSLGDLVEDDSLFYNCEVTAKLSFGSVYNFKEISRSEL